MMSWDFDKSEDKVEFTKFPEGITIVRIVDPAPHVRWTHWMQKNMRSVTCPGFKVCPICEIRTVQKENKETPTYNMGRRLSIQVLNRTTGKLEVMEQGITFFNELKIVMEDLAEKKLTLADVDLSIRRRGLGKDNTVYRIDIGEEYPLTDEDKKLLENKLDLQELFKEHTPEQIIKVINGEDWNEVMYPKNEDDDDEVVLE